jgi:hypothetical protein
VVFDVPQLEIAAGAYQCGMKTVDELWQMAHRLYVRARASVDPATKRMLMQAADDYLKQANAIRRGQVIKAEFPKSDKKFG